MEEMTNATRMEVRNLNAGYGKTEILHHVELKILANTVTALIGPSGCGKSRLISCLNRIL